MLREHMITILNTVVSELEIEIATEPERAGLRKAVKHLTEAITVMYRVNVPRRIFDAMVARAWMTGTEAQQRFGINPYESNVAEVINIVREKDFAFAEAMLQGKSVQIPLDMIERFGE